MRQIITKIFSFFIAIVVLLSTMSFTINMHFCKGNLVDAAVFSKAKPCGKDIKIPLLNSCADLDKDCCSDEYYSVEGQDELLPNTQEDSQITHHFFVASFLISYINLFNVLEKGLKPFKQYSSPYLFSDIHLIYQVFRI